MCPTSYDNTQDRNDSMIGNLFYAMIWRKSATLCPEKMPEVGYSSKRRAKNEKACRGRRCGRPSENNRTAAWEEEEPLFLRQDWEEEYLA